MVSVRQHEITGSSRYLGELAASLSLERGIYNSCPLEADLSRPGRARPVTNSCHSSETPCLQLYLVTFLSWGCSPLNLMETFSVLLGDLKTLHLTFLTHTPSPEGSLSKTAGLQVRDLDDSLSPLLLCVTSVM